MKSRAVLEQEYVVIQGELAQVHQQLLDQESTLERQVSIIDQKDAFIEQLKEALILARNRRFAASTESLRSLQSELFNEAEQTIADAETTTGSSASNDADTIEVPAHRRRQRGRKPLPEELPRLEVIHDLPDEDKVCPHDGHALKAIGDKVSEQLDIVPMRIQVIRHIRKQYVCPCCEGYLKTATKPKQAIEKSQASAGLLAYIAVSKYADSLPLYRQSSILGRFGIEMDRSTLANWMVKCGQLVQPLINRIEEQLLEAPYYAYGRNPGTGVERSGQDGAIKIMDVGAMRRSAG